MSRTDQCRFVVKWSCYCLKKIIEMIQPMHYGACIQTKELWIHNCMYWISRKGKYVRNLWQTFHINHKILINMARRWFPLNIWIILCNIINAATMRTSRTIPTFKSAESWIELDQSILRFCMLYLCHIFPLRIFHEIWDLLFAFLFFSVLSRIYNNTSDPSDRLLLSKAKKI